MGLRSQRLPQAQAGDRVLGLEKEGGRRGVRRRLWNWIWNGIGSDRGWAVVGRKKKSLNRDQETLY